MKKWKKNFWILININKKYKIFINIYVINQLLILDLDFWKNILLWIVKDWEILFSFLTIFGVLFTNI